MTVHLSFSGEATDLPLTLDGMDKEVQVARVLISRHKDILKAHQTNIVIAANRSPSLTESMAWTAFSITVPMWPTLAQAFRTNFDFKVIKTLGPSILNFSWTNHADTLGSLLSGEPKEDEPLIVNALLDRIVNSGSFDNRNVHACVLLVERPEENGNTHAIAALARELTTTHYTQLFLLHPLSPGEAPAEPWSSVEEKGNASYIPYTCTNAGLLRDHLKTIAALATGLPFVIRETPKELTTSEGKALFKKLSKPYLALGG